MRRIAQLSRPSDFVRSSIPRANAPSAACVFCQHRRPARAPFSSTCRRNDILDKTRQALWKDKPPGAEDPYSAQPRSDEADVERQKLSIGGEEMEPYEGEGADAAAFYAKQASREERELYQLSVDEATVHEQYKPASSWDGLEMIGGEKDWDSGAVFEGFVPPEKLQWPNEIYMAIHRALVEVLVMEAAEEPISEMAQPEPGVLITDAAHVKIKPSADGTGAALDFPSERVLKSVIDSVKAGTHTQKHNLEGQEQDVSALPTSDEGLQEALADMTGINKNYTMQSLKEHVHAVGRGWLHVRLDNQNLKLALVHRIFQLTGKRVPDYLINEAKSVSHLVDHLAVPPPPTKLAQELEKGALAQVRNVRISSRRETPIDKEKRVGRWKVIVEELKKRDLPVVGRW